MLMLRSRYADVLNASTYLESTRTTPYIDLLRMDVNYAQLPVCVEYFGWPNLTSMNRLSMSAQVHMANASPKAADLSMIVASDAKVSEATDRIPSADLSLSWSWRKPERQCVLALD